MILVNRTERAVFRCFLLETEIIIMFSVANRLGVVSTSIRKMVLIMFDGFLYSYPCCDTRQLT